MLNTKSLTPTNQSPDRGLVILEAVAKSRHPVFTAVLAGLLDIVLTAIANGKGNMDWAAWAQVAAENAGLGGAGPAD